MSGLFFIPQINVVENSTRFVGYLVIKGTMYCIVPFIILNLY